MPYFSFILPCYNNWELSKQAIITLIESFENKYKQKGIEIIVVNNGSTDETVIGIHELKERYRESIEIIDINLEENMGFIGGTNIGLSKCSGQIITILNNDLIFPEGWFDGLAEILQNDKNVGVAVPYVSNSKGFDQYVEVRSDSIEEIKDFGKKFMKDNKNSVAYTYRILGACVALRRDVLNSIGGLDFWFGIGLFDDIDLSIRISIAGYKIAIVGSSFVHHIRSATFFKYLRKSHDNAFGKNNTKFCKKWSLKWYSNKGLYSSFHEIIENTSYERNMLYFPTKIEEFNSYTVPLINKEKNIKKMLLVADWTNNESKWREKLFTTLHHTSKNDQIYLWIPQQYFGKDEIRLEIMNSLKLNNKEFEKTLPVINCFQDDIPPIDLLRFLNSFDIVMSVESDFVNKYIKYLAKQISLPVE